VSTIFERLPVARVESRAREIDVRRIALGLITAPLMAIGFIAAVGFTVLRWTLAAGLEGWDAGQAATSRASTPRRGG
jgi:hypothetical protein